MMEARERRQDPSNLVWIDLEMTGLNPDVDCILQAALIITSSDLEPLETYCADVWQPESRLSGMVPFVRRMHEKSGLLGRLRDSDVDEKQLGRQLLERISGWCPYHAILCGNTIHSDRKFIARYLPAVDGYLHYRMVDVSSFKVLAELWHPKAIFTKPRSGQHDALFDIQQSIAELRHYRTTMMRSPGSIAAVPL
jgi:oligoribonuclease